MNSIIITSIICASIIIIVSIFCYTSYKDDENAKSNRYFKTVNATLKQYDNMLNEIHTLLHLTKDLQSCIEFMNIQISNKENNKDK